MARTKQTARKTDDTNYKELRELRDTCRSILKGATTLPSGATHAPPSSPIGDACGPIPDLIDDVSPLTLEDLTTENEEPVLKRPTKRNASVAFVKASPTESSPKKTKWRFKIRPKPKSRTGSKKYDQLLKTGDEKMRHTILKHMEAVQKMAREQIRQGVLGKFEERCTKMYDVLTNNVTVLPPCHPPHKWCK